MLEEFENLMTDVWIDKILIDRVLKEAEDNLWKMRCPLEKGE